MNSIVRLLVMLLATATARADLVTVIATGTLREFSDPDGLLPFSAADAELGFTLTVSINTSKVNDLSSDPALGAYSEAIQSIHLTVGEVTVAPFDEQLVVIFDDQLSTGGELFADRWLATTQRWTPLSPDGSERREGYDLSLIRWGTTAPIEPFDSDALVMPPWPYEWSQARIRYGITDYDAEGMPIATLARASATIGNMEVIVGEVPLPSAAWLLPTALFAMIGRTRRRAAP